MKVLYKHTKLILFLIDIVIISFSYFITQIFYMENVFTINNNIWSQIINTILISILIYEFFLNLFEVYKNITVYESAKEYFCYALASFASCNAVTMIGIIFNLNILPVKETLLAGFFVAALLIFYRVIIRFVLTNRKTIKSVGQARKILEKFKTNAKI